MNKHMLLIILCLFLNLFSPFVVCAEEFTSEKSGLDVMFVMDYSGSMKSNDSMDMARGMVKAFVDTVHSTDIRVGFVAYNDRILSSTSPLAIRTSEERAVIKELIDKETYSGNTDIGLGLSYGCELINNTEKRKRVIVLMSDGESDLHGSNTGRKWEDSQRDIEETAKQCAVDGIQIYTIAFGAYDGNKNALEVISETTSAQMYTAETPEKLIEILYGIFNTNMDYSIREVTDSVYAPGKQNIRVGLEEKYLDELDILLISPQNIGDVHILYHDKEIETINHKNYVVGKITEIDDDITELTVQLETEKNQELQIYLVSYRALSPVFSVNTSMNKNEELHCELYFRDKAGNMVEDEAFYQNFTCRFWMNNTEDIGNTEEEENTKNKPLDNGNIQILNTKIIHGHIQGNETLKQSGTWLLYGHLEDPMGSIELAPIQVTVKNRVPEGELPKIDKCTVLSKETQIQLNDYFSDPDGDNLVYTLKDTGTKALQAEITDEVLRVKPVEAGTGIVELDITDGEAVYTCTYEAEVIPLWKAYWWVAVLAVILCIAIVWKLTHKPKPKPQLKQLVADTRKNQFCGKLDAYFTLQPETEEIRPLSFSMYQFADNKLSLDVLFHEYPEAIEALELDAMYLVADEERKMVLYHTSKSSVMIGNSIVCREIQYSVSFGDVIYITSPNKRYDLEIHYIAVIQ